MILESLKKQEGYTNSEKSIAEYILNHIASIFDMTANELGNETYTSKTTVLRFCKKLNTKGFKDFQKRLLQEYNGSKREISSNMISGQSTVRDISAAVSNMNYVVMERIRASLDYGQVSRIVKMMKESPYIEIYGVAESYILAQEAAFKIRSLGKSCYAMTGLNEHSIEMTPKYKNKNVAILLSFTGANTYICEIAETLRKSGYYVIGISGNSSNKLKDRCSSCIMLNLNDLILSMEVLTAQCSIQYILNILYVSLLKENYDKNVEGAIEVYKGKYLYQGKNNSFGPFGPENGL